jgi:flagellar hook-basal body complex protein FliE
MIEAVSALANVTQTTGVSTEFTRTGAVSGAPTMSFTQAMKSAAMEQVQTVQNSEAMTMGAMHGKASLQDVVGATVKAELAVETAMAVRNKMIEAYQEIMRMPV